jgi:hypothetical protein
MISSLNLNDLPATYGCIANLILMKICVAQIVDFVCDTYRTPSIKAGEQERRGISELNI